MLKYGEHNIAVLLACYNRKEKTLRFIESLTSQPYFAKLHADIYLLDDGSTDGTADALKAKFNFVHIVAGSGNLYWAGGMRTVWAFAMQQKHYDIFLLFNDDVVLFKDSIERLLQTYMQAGKTGAVIIGSTVDPQTRKISYGGNRMIAHLVKPTEFALILPDTTVAVPCRLGNGNVLLVDNATVQKIGIFSPVYTHYLADFDYTYTASKAGIPVLIAPGYYGLCENDHGVSWLTSKSPLKQRIKYLYHAKGLAYKEYLYFIRKYFPAAWLRLFIKLWMKTLFPLIWEKFKKRSPAIESADNK